MLTRMGRFGRPVEFGTHAATSPRVSGDALYQRSDKTPLGVTRLHGRNLP
jgi:hypothetical protein